MADLLDIAPSISVENVKIASGRRIKVRGLQINDMASIAARFPALVALLDGGDNIVARLFAQLGVAIGPVIAAGCGHLGDEKAEQIVGTLLVEDQMRLVAAIYRLTFPNDMAPFIEAMTALMGGAAIEENKIVKVRLRQSPSPLPTSSDVAFPPTMQ